MRHCFRNSGNLCAPNKTFNTWLKGEEVRGWERVMRGHRRRDRWSEYRSRARETNYRIEKKWRTQSRRSRRCSSWTTALKNENTASRTHAIDQEQDTAKCFTPTGNWSKKRMLIRLSSYRCSNRLCFGESEMSLLRWQRKLQTRITRNLTMVGKKFQHFRNLQILGFRMVPSSSHEIYLRSGHSLVIRAFSFSFE